MIAIDCEVYENDLKGQGPGWHRGDSAVIMIGMYNGATYNWYEPGSSALAERLAEHTPKVFHNSVYDMGWLVHGLKLPVNGTIHDTMTRAALIDEYAEMNLDDCCKRFGVKGKNKEDTIETWFEKRKKDWGLKGTVWSNIDLLWADPEGRKAMIAYNEQDCKATYELFMEQEQYMDLHREPYQLECELQPIISMLNGNGFRVDEVSRDCLTEQIKRTLKDELYILNHEYGIKDVNFKSPKQLTVAMNTLGIKSPALTATGAQSWNAEALDDIDHPVIEHIQNVQKLTTLLNNFLEGSLLKLVDGRAYSVFKPNKRDDGGTITGRFGSAKMNLQQIPARTETASGIKSYGQEIRSLFLPDEGYWLGSYDLSNIEMRMLAHLAVGAGAEELKQAVRDGVDFHTRTAEMTGLERDYAKRLNFTIIYGAGPNGIFKKNKKAFKTLEYTKQVYNQYHAGMPVIRTTMTAIENEARAVGYVKSIGNRVHHKPRPSYDPEKGRWNDGMYKMTNYVDQGGSADHLKRALLDAYEAGCFEVLKLHAVVHDEIVVSIPKTVEGIAMAVKLQDCMENAYKDRWTVPVKCGAEVGTSWGSWDSAFWNEVKKDPLNWAEKEGLLK